MRRPPPLLLLLALALATSLCLEAHARASDSPSWAALRPPGPCGRAPLPRPLPAWPSTAREGKSTTPGQLASACPRNNKDECPPTVNDEDTSQPDLDPERRRSLVEGGRGAGGGEAGAWARLRRAMAAVGARRSSAPARLPAAAIPAPASARQARRLAAHHLCHSDDEGQRCPPATPSLAVGAGTEAGAGLVGRARCALRRLLARGRTGVEGVEGEEVAADDEWDAPAVPPAPRRAARPRRRRRRRRCRSYAGVGVGAGAGAVDGAWPARPVSWCIPSREEDDEWELLGDDASPPSSPHASPRPHPRPRQRP